MKQESWLQIAGAGLAAGAALPPLLGWAAPVGASLKLAGALALGGVAIRMLRRHEAEQTRDDRDAGTYIVGKQRSGKTTLASLLFEADIRSPHSWTHRPIPWLPYERRYWAANDKGAAWVTTHGARDIAALVPDGRLTLFSPPRTPGINILAGGDAYAAANRVSTVMGRMWPDLGDIQQQLLYTAALTVAQERPDATLWDVLRFCDGERHDFSVESEIAQRAWASPDKGAVKGLVARLGRMLASPRLSRGLADPDGIDLDAEVRSQRVVVADLTQDDTADALVLAAALVGMLQQVAVHRPADAPSYPVFLDEFQSYADESVEVWIAEGGKRHMPVTLLHQARKQLSPRLAAVTLSCGTIYCMAVNIHDARELATELGVDDPALLSAQPPRSYRARILSHGRIVYRKGRTPYVDRARRKDSRGRVAARRTDDGDGGAGALPAHEVGAPDGAA